MKVNTCNICGATSDETVFYAGVSSRCAECHKVKARENRRAKLEYYRAYDAKRYQEDPRVKDRHRRYAKTEAGKESLTKARKKWTAENEEKRAAHVILGNRIRDGKVKKPDTCQKCGATGCRIDGHHEDYSKPLDVLWLCRFCHVEHHRNHQP